MLDIDDREENISILEEAAAIRTVNLKAQLKTNQSDHSMETVSIQLLRELQEAQDVETAKLIKRLPNMVSICILWHDWNK